MPELPEVEIARGNFHRWAKGRRIVDVTAPTAKVIPLRGVPLARFRGTLVGARYVETERRGKNLVARFARRREAIGLRLHLGMTGKILRRKAGAPAPRFTRASLVFSGGVVIHFADQRQFGDLEAGPLEPVREHAFEGLGPDPLIDGIDARVLAERLARTRQPVKVALMDQARIAGLGNIHAAEALWRAKIAPARRADRLRPAELTALATGIRGTIRDAIRREDREEVVYVEEPGAPNPFTVYDHAGESCPRCGHPIRRTIQAGRSTFWCKGCQR